MTSGPEMCFIKYFDLPFRAPLPGPHRSPLWVFAFDVTSLNHFAQAPHRQYGPRRRTVHHLSAVSRNFPGRIASHPGCDIKFQKDLRPCGRHSARHALSNFQLNDATGNKVSLADLLANGALLISFYRGEGCPFCNLELRALQSHLDEFHGRG